MGEPSVCPMCGGAMTRGYVAECGHGLKKLAAMLRREETKYGDRLARLPIRRTTKVPFGQTHRHKQVTSR